MCGVFLQDLKLVGKDQSWDQSDLPYNRAKNRYANIKPYDISRVKLLPVEDEDGTDYINACWIQARNQLGHSIVTFFHFAASPPLPPTPLPFRSLPRGEWAGEGGGKEGGEEGKGVRLGEQNG